MPDITLRYRRPNVPFHELTLGQRVAWLLKRRKLSQTAAAKLCDLSQATFANLIGGKRAPSAETLMKLSRGLDSSPSFIMYGHGFQLSAAEADDDKQAEILDIYRKVNATQQHMILVFARMQLPVPSKLLKEPKIKKDSSEDC